MSASCCVVFYGLRFNVAAEEIESLELRRDQRMMAARDARLDTYWGNFGGLDERYVLLIGSRIGILGPENQLEIQARDDEWQAMVSGVRQKLRSNRFEGEPQLHILWEEDV